MTHQRMMVHIMLSISMLFVVSHRLVRRLDQLLLMYDFLRQKTLRP